MGLIKNKKEEIKTYGLSDREWNYLKILNLITQYNTFRDKVFSGFLYEICNLRFNYPQDVNLVFEFDLEDDRQQLKVREIETSQIQEALKNAQAAA